MPMKGTVTFPYKLDQADSAQIGKDPQLGVVFYI